MFQGEHSAKLLTIIKLPFVTKSFVLFIFERPFYTGFTVLELHFSFMYVFVTATYPAPSSPIPVGLKFLFRNFESKI